MRCLMSKAGHPGASGKAGAVHLCIVVNWESVTPPGEPPRRPTGTVPSGHQKGAQVVDQLLGVREGVEAGGIPTHRISSQITPG